MVARARALPHECPSALTRRGGAATQALEPIFVVLFSFLIDGKMDKFSINFWLLPIIAGVIWAAVGSKIAAGTDIFADINPAREPREHLPRAPRPVSRAR